VHHVARRLESTIRPLAWGARPLLLIASASRAWGSISIATISTLRGTS
jgi:hypothetical protein